MSGYTQTILFDANRLSSEEFSASNLANTNNAIYTNKVASGITIDIGDQVSITSAHIAQRGAGTGTIEMKGDVLAKTKIITTSVENSSLQGYLKNGSMILGDNFRYSPTGYGMVSCSNVEEEVSVKDNEASIVIEYYKTSNGENNISLPRNFGNASGRFAVHSDYPTTLSSSGVWESLDGYVLGAQTYYRSASHIASFDYQEQEMHSYKDSVLGGTKSLSQKLRQDNSTYTIFQRADAVYNGSAVSASDVADYLTGRGIISTTPDPALAHYHRFRQKVVLGVKEGYNSPSNIASQLTDKLIETTEPIKLLQATGVENSYLINSTVTKGFPCCNYETFNSSTNEAYFNASVVKGMPVKVGAKSKQSAEAIAYLNAYNFVGFKRPDFVEAGRNAVAYHGANVEVGVGAGEQSTAVIVTDISWSDNALSGIKTWFDSQSTYPELLDGGCIEVNASAGSFRTKYPTFNTTSSSLCASFREEARFVHTDLNLYNKATGSLGSDMYNVSYSTNTAQPDRANASDMTSYPLFIYFNKNCSNLTVSGKTTKTIGDTYDNLAYGFGRRYNIGTAVAPIYKLAFTTERIGGLTDAILSHNGGLPLYGPNVLIGYDYHFSAYGNAAIILSNGFAPLQYYGHQRFREGDKIENVYIGSDNPLINFDTTESRFTISNLHTSEKVGNFFNAGDPDAPNDIFSPPPSGQASQDCYKINKPMRYDSWTPCMQPYQKITTTGSFTMSNQNTFIGLNINLSTEAIFDAHSGITIVDMGVPEKNWDFSLWGLLGFRYGQFNASFKRLPNVKSPNIRFTDRDQNASGMTTNANVTSQDSLNYTLNAFGTNLFNPMINSHVFYYNDTQKPSTIGAASFTVEQPTIVSTTSTSIRALDLPRKLLRGYFLLNSNIINQSNYYQLSNPLQTMAIVGKYNSSDDFVNYDGGGTVFTATRKSTITEITTQILDPEGSLAQVGDNSGVVYRIDKTIKTDLNFAETLMAQGNKK
tara:strand:+ start:13074 stop:16031 length:2958 start_codon:yes stop_codon:yes gene_type:complete